MKVDVDIVPARIDLSVALVKPEILLSSNPLRPLLNSCLAIVSVGDDPSNCIPEIAFLYCCNKLTLSILS